MGHTYTFQYSSFHSSVATLEPHYYPVEYTANRSMCLAKKFVQAKLNVVKLSSLHMSHSIL